MHSCEALAGAPPPTPPASGPGLLLQLAQLIVRSRSPPPRAKFQTKLCGPSTSQIVTQPRPEEPTIQSALDATLNTHIHALWSEQIPICIEILLAPDCKECFTSLNRDDAEGAFDRSHAKQKGLLLERWTITPMVNKGHETPAFITSQWLLNAVRSQLHFSQLSAWIQRLKAKDEPQERRRKLSREKCNFKKIESNCEDLSNDRNLHIVYSVKIPGESYRVADFNIPPNDHVFPITDIGNNIYLKVNLESMPRIDEIPIVKCFCRHAEDLALKLHDLTLSSKTKFDGNTRRLSKEYLFHDVQNVNAPIVDDIMHTPCSESGKHRCACDDESDFNNKTKHDTLKLDERRLKEIAKYKRRLRKESKLKKLSDSTSSEGELKKEVRTSIPILQAARFDRFRAIGCYRNQTYLTLPASRMETKSPFIDTAIVPPTEYKKTVSIGIQTDDLQCKCGNNISLKSDNSNCSMVRSEATYNLSSIDKGDFNAAKSLYDSQQNSEKFMEAIEKCQDDNVVRRKNKMDIEEKSTKKLKCDNLSSNLKCDININDINDSFKHKDIKDNYYTRVNERDDELIKRPKLRRFYPIVDRIERIVSDRKRDNETEKEMEELHLMNDDTVFSIPKHTINDNYKIQKDNFKTQNDNIFPSHSRDVLYNSISYLSPQNSKLNLTSNLYSNDSKSTPQNFISKPSNSDIHKPEPKRQKTFSINEDEYIFYEKCDYGTIDIDSPSTHNDIDSPQIDIDSPQIDIDSPQIDIESPQIDIDSPQIDIDSPHDTNEGFKFPDIKSIIDPINLNIEFNDKSIKEENLNETSNSKDTQNDLNTQNYFNLNSKQTSNNSKDKMKAPFSLDLDCFNFNQYKGKSKNHNTQNFGNQNEYHQKYQIEKHDSHNANSDEMVVDQLSQKQEQLSQDFHNSNMKADNQVPSPSEMDRFRWRFDSAASMVFHTLTGLPLTSSPAPLRRGNNCFDFDHSINGINGIKSALYHPYSPPPPVPASPPAAIRPKTPPPMIETPKLRIGPSTGLLGSFEESALKGRLEPVSTVHGFTAELGASGAFCPPHKRLPVTVFFYAPGGTNAPYLAHINLGSGYRVPRSGTVQVSLFNPHGTLVKMFVVLYDLTSMPPSARTFLRQRTLYMPACADTPRPELRHKWLRYLIHLRFMTSKSGKLYLHTDIRIIVSRKADLDTATAHSALFRPLTNQNAITKQPTNQREGDSNRDFSTNEKAANVSLSTNRVNRICGGSSEECEIQIQNSPEISYDSNSQGVSYELRSFTYAPENPKYSPR